MSVGANYSSVQIRSDDRGAVRRLVEELSREQKQQFLVGPEMNGWIGVYPKWCDYSKLCRAIARKLKAELFLLVIQYDDIFVYEYYRDGKQVDRYNSYPDYHKDPGPRERQNLIGRPDRFAHLVTDDAHFAALEAALADPRDDRFIFAGALLDLFASTLGIPNALTCYEYLIDGEEAAVDDWSQFEHFPDLREENSRKRNADDALRAHKKALISEGLLLTEIGGLKGYDKPWPRYCPATDRGSVFVVSSNHADDDEQPVPLQRYGPPWSAGPATTALMIDRHVYGLALSPSGRYLAVAHAAGDWKATLWDLRLNKKVVEAPQVRAVSWVGFTPDNVAMISISSDANEGRIAITPVDGSDTATISLAGVSIGAIHPFGEKLVATDGGARLVVVDLATRQVEQTVSIGARRPGFERETGPGIGSEGVNRILFDPAGDRLFLGTTAGVRVFLWDEVLRSKADMPPPVMSFDAPSYIMETAGSSRSRPGDVHALAFDPNSQRLLFAGSDGQLRFLDLQDGRTHLLLAPLEPGPILALDLTRDRSTLVVSSQPELGKSLGNPRGLAIQFWNYSLLCHEARSKAN